MVKKSPSCLLLSLFTRNASFSVWQPWSKVDNWLMKHCERYDWNSEWNTAGKVEFEGHVCPRALHQAFILLFPHCLWHVSLTDFTCFRGNCQDQLIDKRFAKLLSNVFIVRAQIYLKCTAVFCLPLLEMCRLFAFEDGQSKIKPGLKSCFTKGTLLSAILMTL